MSNNRGKNWFSFGWHPAEEELLLFLDGETSERQADRIRAHLEGCWACRNQRDKFDRAIAAFMDYCEADATDAGALPPRAGARFAERLRTAASTQPKPSLITRWTTVLRWQFAERRPAVVATACLLLVASLVWILSRAERPVSAQELLRRTTQAETLSLSRVGEPVVYRKLQVKRVGAGEPVVWESWNDAHRNQFRQRVADKNGLRFLRANDKATPAVIAELEQIFRASHFDPQRPLSAAAFAEWRKSIRTKSENVAASREELKLTTIAQQPSAVNTITEALLIVRKSDWHAIALHLQVQGEHEIRQYELSETAYEVLPLQALTVFADPVPTPSPAPAIVAAASPAASPAIIANASPSPAPPPSEAEVKEAEVAAMYALHQAQADLGEQIEVVREAGQGVIVRGLVETPERKQRLTEALRDIPLVAARIQTIEEATRQAGRQAAASQAARAAEAVTPNEPVISAASGAQAGNAFEQRLARYFAEREPASSDRGKIDLKIARLFNQVVTESSAAMSEAWALRRLLERFAAEKENDLSPAARQRIEEMMANHIARLKTQNHNLRARLEPVLLSIAGGKTPAVRAPAPVESTKQAQALLLFRAVEQAQRMIQRLVTGAASAATPEEAARQLIEALARLDHALLSFEQAISR